MNENSKDNKENVKLFQNSQKLVGNISGGNSMSGNLNNPIVETGNYNKLDNKPSINNVVLIGNRTLKELDIQQTMECLTNIEIEDLLGE